MKRKKTVIHKPYVSATVKKLTAALTIIQSLN